MKKLFATILMAGLILTLAACGGPHEERVLEEDLETLLEDIHSYQELSGDTKDFLDNLEVKEVSEDREEYHLGTTAYDYERALANVPSLSTTPFELTLVRVAGGEDIGAFRDAIEENVDPMKWGSFGVDPENVIVDNIGDVIVIIMSDEHAESLHEAFLALEEQYDAE
ncbi:MAG: hypothetical protein ACOCSM_02460 [Bacillota bacterium]